MFVDAAVITLLVFSKKNYVISIFELINNPDANCAMGLFRFFTLMNNSFYIFSIDVELGKEKLVLFYFKAFFFTCVKKIIFLTVSYFESCA